MRPFKNPKVYALILNYNSSEETVELYHNILECSYNEVEILVIDNFSENSDRKYLKKNIPKKNLILNNKNKGYAAGNNLGIELALKSHADYIWILNPDIRVEKDALSILVETLEKDRALAAVGPRILKREDQTKIFTDGEKLLLDIKCSTHQKNHNKSKFEVEPNIDYDIDYIDGSCILIKSEAIRELGFLPEEYFLYFEETDWCTLAKKHGWKLAVNSNGSVYNITSKKTEIFHYYFMRNRLIFSKKYHPESRLVVRYYFSSILKEFISRFKGKYFRPFYKQRVKGFIAGFLFIHTRI